VKQRRIYLKNKAIDDGHPALRNLAIKININYQQS